MIDISRFFSYRKVFKFLRSINIIDQSLRRDQIRSELRARCRIYASIVFMIFIIEAKSKQKFKTALLQLLGAQFNSRPFLRNFAFGVWKWLAESLQHP